jgi:hypothetical protein
MLRLLLLLLRPSFLLVLLLESFVLLSFVACTSAAFASESDPCVLDNIYIEGITFHTTEGSIHFNPQIHDYYCEIDPNRNSTYLTAVTTQAAYRADFHFQNPGVIQTGVLSPLVPSEMLFIHDGPNIFEITPQNCPAEDKYVIACTRTSDAAPTTTGADPTNTDSPSQTATQASDGNAGALLRVDWIFSILIIAVGGCLALLDSE